MIWARWAGVIGVPMKWEIARIFVVGTGGSGFCAEGALAGVIGLFIAVAPYSSFGILLLIVSVFDARTASAGRRRRHQPLSTPKTPVQPLSTDLRLTGSCTTAFASCL